MDTTTTTSSDAEKRWTELLNAKNERLGRSIVELEESRKLLNRLKELLTPAERRTIDARIDHIAKLVNELTH